MNFNTSNESFRKLLGNGLRYQIPPFQRDYSWGDEEWDDLWADILGTVKDGGELAHYMGYLVLQSGNEKAFDVIDGQQRITTLSLIVLAVLKSLQKLIDAGVEAENNTLRRDQIRNIYIGFLDPVTLVPRSKLTLNRNNDHYYQTYLVPLVVLPQRGFRASEHGLRKAFEWFDRQLTEYLKQVTTDKGVALAEFVESMSDRLFFTVITVTDELNAYKVFETLNARGVRLSATDLLKNYLFSVLYRAGQHEHELKVLENRWEAIVGRLGSESFPDFLRVHWNSRKTPVRQTELFKTIRGQVGGPEAVFALVRDMESDLDAYLSLTQPVNSAWPADQRADVTLLRMFSVRQPFPLLLATRMRLDDVEFGKVLRACVVISFRYNIIGGLSTGDQERVYNVATRAMIDGSARAYREIVERLQPIYPSDVQFKAAFAEKAIKTSSPRNNRIVKHILCKIERHLSGVECDFESDALSVEHILPRNPQAGWIAFPENESEAWAYRLGNMTLLETSKNRDVGNKEYVEKRPVYAASAFTITTELAERYPEWSPERIERRQRWMADQASSLWRVEQLSN